MMMAVFCESPDIARGKVTGEVASSTWARARAAATSVHDKMEHCQCMEDSTKLAIPDLLEDTGYPQKAPGILTIRTNEVCEEYYGEAWSSICEEIKGQMNA